MNPTGSFYPLSGDDPTTRHVLFALAIDSHEQRQAVHNEVLCRLSAVAALSDALTTAYVEAHGARTHAPFLEAIAILSRDAKGLLEAALNAQH